MTDHTAVVQVPVAGLSIVTDFPGGRQMTVQFHAPIDMAPTDISLIADRMLSVVDRLRAKAEIVGLEDEIEQHERALRRFNDDLEKVEAGFQEQQEIRGVQLEEMERMKHERLGSALKLQGKEREELMASRQSTLLEGERDFRSRDRNGPYTPKGQVKTNLDRIDQGLATLDERQAAAIRELDADCQTYIDAKVQEIARADNERTVAIQGLMASIQRFNEEVERCRVLIVKKQALVGD